MAVVKPTALTDVSPIQQRLGSGAVSGNTGLTLGPGDDLDGLLVKKRDEEDQKAKYKIEVIFSSHRSSLPSVPSPLVLQIWESGKRFHGGGDQKMYWCGYDDCDKPISSDCFAYMHAVCTHCNRELFLDPDAKKAHRVALAQQGKSPTDLDRIPMVAGERFANLIPSKLAELLEKTFRSLGSHADIYLKYSPLEIRYDSKHETTSDLNRLDEVRVQRVPSIYTFKNIMKDISAGASLRNRFVTFITS